jgi:ADP-heptose:LPS heptosyltransferase
MLTVSTVIWNPELAVFTRFLKSLKEFTPELMELIVVDNASESDNYKQFLEHYFKGKYRLIVNKINKGYGQAHNQALDIATQRYFAVMNDDIEFYENWAGKFMGILEDSSVGQVGPLNGVCNMWTEKALAYGKQTDDPDYIEGSLFMMRTETAKKYKLFDPVYGLGYYEDGDLSLRLKRDGYKLKQVMVSWKHWVESSFKRLRSSGVDTAGFQVINKKLFEERWNSYILNHTFGPLIIVKRTASYGDVFLTTTIFKALKKKYPDCCLVLMTAANEESLRSDYVDVVAQPDIPITCNIFINLDYAYEKDFTKHIVDAYAKEANVENYLETYSGILTTIEDKNPIKHFIPDDIGDHILIDVGQSWQAKQWNPKYYEELIDRLRTDGIKIATVGVSRVPVNVKYDLSYLNVCNIEQTIYLLRKARMYVGHEGLLAHICQSIDKDCVVLYTCTTPKYVSDLSKECLHIIETKATCKGCRHRYMAGVTVLCPREFICTKMISVDSVYNKIKEVLK